jgi:hypothetical protein
MKASCGFLVQQLPALRAVRRLEQSHGRVRPRGGVAKQLTGLGGIVSDENATTRLHDRFSCPSQDVKV